VASGEQYGAERRQADCAMLLHGGSVSSANGRNGNPWTNNTFATTNRPTQQRVGPHSH
jgi:hypothetical protein